MAACRGKYGRYISEVGGKLLVRVPGTPSCRFALDQGENAMAERDRLAATVGIDPKGPPLHFGRTKRVSKSKAAPNLPSGVSLIDNNCTYLVVWREGPPTDRRTKTTRIYVSDYDSQAAAEQAAIETRAKKEALHYG